LRARTSYPTLNKKNNMTTPRLIKLIGRSPSRLALPLIPFLFACLALSPVAQAVLPPPPPDGGYPNNNTAEGDSALFSLTTGLDNTAIGFQALFHNTTGGPNTAIGDGALFENISGGDNVAIGDGALGNTTSSGNTATGTIALVDNTTGFDNTADGSLALENNTTGRNNVALGALAGSNLTTGSDNIDIGANVLGLAGEAKTIRIGKSGTQMKTFVAGIHGATVANGVGVIVGTTGQLGTLVSSARFKEAIKAMDKASEAILALKPVTFRYKEELDPDHVPQFGLIAEEVEKVNPALVVGDEDGKVNAVRYEAVNAMLLNEFLKEHKKTEKLEATVASLIATVKEQAAQIQKVSAQLEAGKPAPQVVNNNQ
jgi:hypothetical protein